jgi:hypothetical protein
MRRAFHGVWPVALLAATVFGAAGCRGRWPFTGHAPIEARDGAKIAWRAVDASAVEVVDQGERGGVRYRVHLPPADAGGGARHLAISFERPLDGAKIDAVAAGRGNAQPLAHDRRVGGSRVDLPLGTMRWESVDVVVHHHLRQPPIVRAVLLAAGPGPTTTPTVR